MTEMVPGVSRVVKKDEAYYTLVWSPLKKADKYEITLKVPSVAGLYELYKMDKQKKLNLLSVTHAWYGGLRSQLRAAVDPDATNDPVRKAELEDTELYYRYAPSGSLEDILDVVWFLHSTYFPDDVRVEDSGRYTRIYLNEKAPDRVYWLD
jgi:hypothetical protein